MFLRTILNCFGAVLHGSVLSSDSRSAEADRSVRSPGQTGRVAPILTFQSLIDFTVSTRAIVSALYDYLPANGSELVLFDINRTAKFGPLLRSSADTALACIVPRGPRRYRLTVVTSANGETDNVIVRVTDADSGTEYSRPLG
jgi:hypothetical protein